MKHVLDDNFHKNRVKLPRKIQRRIPRKFQLIQENPRHHSLRFQKKGVYWSIRISKGYRALARKEEDTFVWFWVGAHDEYERLIQ